MGTLRRVAGTLAVGLFVLRYALRPLGGTTALADLPREWSDLLPFLPLVALSGFLLVLAALAVVRGDGLALGSGAEEPAQSSERENEADLWATERKKERVCETDSGENEDGEIPERYRNHPAVSPDLFEDRSNRRIEEREPDADLREHLAHLERELDDAGEELATLESVAEEESTREIPARCPAEGCDAVWSGRTPLGIRTDRYDVLADGRLVCLDCEELYDPG